MAKIKSLSSFSNLEDLDSQESEQLEGCFSKKGLTFSSMLAMMETFDEEDFQELECRSTKKPSKGEEVSFELIFMRQHSSTLAQSLSKFMECLPELSIKSLPAVPHDGIISVAELQTLVKSVLAEGESRLFLIDLGREERLSEFVRLACGMTGGALSRDIVRVAHHVWLAFLPIQSRHLKDCELMEFGEEVLDSVARSQSLANEVLVLSCGDALGEQRKRSIHSFLRYFIVTSLFIIQEFYVNPFYQREQHPSLLCEGEHPTVATGRKISRLL